MPNAVSWLPAVRCYARWVRDKRGRMPATPAPGAKGLLFVDTACCSLQGRGGPNTAQRHLALKTRN